MAGMPSMDTPQELDQLLTVETDKGILFKICLGVALFFTGSQQEEKRQAVLDILADYRDLVGGLSDLNPLGLAKHGGRARTVLTRWEETKSTVPRLHRAEPTEK